MPSAIPCSLSCSLFSRTKGILSPKFFHTQIPSIFIEKLVLPRQACCFSIGLAESRVLAAPANTSHLVLHCPATDYLCYSLFGDSCLSTTSGPGPMKLPGFWGFMVFHLALIPRKGLGNSNNPIKTRFIASQLS